MLAPGHSAPGRRRVRLAPFVSVPRETRISRVQRQQRRAWRTLVDWGAQLAIAAVGVISVFDETLVSVVIWCVLATAYATTAFVVIAVHVRHPRDLAHDEPMPKWFARIRGVLAVVLTIVPTLIGMSSALTVVVVGRDPSQLDFALLVNIIGVWSMLLAWGYLHWGFTQIYLHRSLVAWPEPLLAFPQGDRPGLIEHIYFAYTVGTTFAASDVSVLTTPTRWVVTIHSVLGFFMNAFVIVLSFNTITGVG